MNVARGRILKEGKLIYKSDRPLEEGEEVIILTKRDLEEFVASKTAALRLHRVPMDSRHWDLDFMKNDYTGSCANCPHIADQIVIKDRAGNPHKLYLDRRGFYSPFPIDELWIRYTEVDQAIIEGEWPTDTSLHIPQDKPYKNQQKSDKPTEDD